MDLRTIAQPLPTTHSGTFHFGLDPSRLTTFLRNLADKFEAKALIPAEVKYEQKATRDDYVVATLTLSFHAPSPPPNAKKT
jgi:hypothetical protein